MRRPIVGIVLAALAVAGIVTQGAALGVLPQIPRIVANVRVDGRLLYVARGQIKEWAGGASRALTQPGIRYESAEYSPDGTLIAASEVGENHSDIILLDASGSRIRPLTRHWSNVSISQSAWGRTPSWSPDGARIAYASDLGGTDMSLWTVARGGGDNRRIWTLPLGSAGLDFPAWSPDGDQIAFVSYPGGHLAPSQVYVLTPARGAVTKVTDIENGAFDPSWSPDGRTIAYVARVGVTTEIRVVTPDGAVDRRITEGHLDRSPVFSPNGLELAFLRSDGLAFDLYAVAVGIDGVSEPRRLTNGEDPDGISGISWRR